MPFTTTLDQFLICLAKHFPLSSSKYFLPFKLRTKHLIWTRTCCCFRVCLLSMLLLYNSLINKKLIPNFWLNVLGECISYCIRYCILSFYIVDKKRLWKQHYVWIYSFLKTVCKRFWCIQWIFYYSMKWCYTGCNDNMANIVSIWIKCMQNRYYIEHIVKKKYLLRQCAILDAASVFERIGKDLITHSKSAHCIILK